MPRNVLRFVQTESKSQDAGRLKNAFGEALTISSFRKWKQNYPRKLQPKKAYICLFPDFPCCFGRKERSAFSI